MTEIGHNSGEPTFPPKAERRMARPAATSAPAERDTASDQRLRLLVERIERLEEEKKAIADDIRDVYAEAKAVGYDPKITREMVRLRKMDPNARAEMEALLDIYKSALGLG